MGFSRQGDWSGLLFPLWWIFPTQGSNPRILHQQADASPLCHLGRRSVAGRTLKPQLSRSKRAELRRGFSASFRKMGPSPEMDLLQPLSKLDGSGRGLWPPGFPSHTQHEPPEQAFGVLVCWWATWGALQLSPSWPALGPLSAPPTFWTTTFLGFPFWAFTVDCLSVWKSSFILHFPTWASEDFFSQRRSPLGLAIALRVPPMAGGCSSLPAPRGSRHPCPHLLVVFCPSLLVCSRASASSLSVGTEHLALGLGCWCKDFQEGLGYALQGRTRNLYPQKRALRSQ